MKSFPSIGEVMIELAENGEGLFKKGVAGDTLNTAFYARQFLPESCKFSYLTALGSDPASDGIIAFINSTGVDCQYITRLKDKAAGLFIVFRHAKLSLTQFWCRFDNHAAPISLA